MRTHSTAHLVLAALLCALTAVLSQIQIPLPPVPASLSLLGVHLCGTLLPTGWSAAAMAAYVLLGACGVPVFAGFLGGPSILIGPTGGYLAGYILCAALESSLLLRLGRSRRALLIAMTAGTVGCYALGTTWFVLSSGSGLAQSLMLCVIPFIPGDVLKLLLAAALTRRLQKTFSHYGLCAQSS